MKNILRLSIAVLVILLLGGCVVIIPNTPTQPPPVTQPSPTSTPISNLATITIVSSDGVHGSVYIDGIYQGILQPNGTLTTYGIDYGTHTLTLDTVVYSYSIDVTTNGQTINIDWYGNSW